jgi:hypothetical protein
LCRKCGLYRDIRRELKLAPLRLLAETWRCQYVMRA